MALAFPNGSDVLPPGRHSATVLEVEAALVKEFAESARRRPLYQRWLAVREAIRRIVAVEEEWLDGSYVTRVLEPHDIDMVSHLPHHAVNGLDEAGKAMLLGLVAGHRSRELHGCDSFILVVYPDEHPQHAVYLQALQLGQPVRPRPLGHPEGLCGGQRMTRRVEDELKDLDSAISAASEQAAAEDFGVELMRESLLRRREILLEEADGVLELALRGAVSEVTGAEVPLVASVLESLQDTLASIAQVLAGEPTSRGLIPTAIKEMVALRIAWAAPGSLQLRLLPAHPASEGPEPEVTLFDAVEGDDEEEEELPLLDRSMERLIGLLGHTDEEREDLLQGIAEVGPRTTTHLQHLSKTLGEGGANASLVWRSAKMQRSTTFSRGAAQRLARTLDQVQEQSRQVVYTGRLVGGSLVHRTFELELDTDGSVIAGKVSDDALFLLEEMQLGQSCTARIEVREATLPSGETREAHTLVHLAE